MDRRLLVCVCLLFAAGIAGIVYKNLFLDFSLTPNEQAPLWQIEGRITFIADGNPISVSLAAPSQHPGYRVYSIDEVSTPAYAFRLTGTDEDRRAEWTAPPASGPQTILFRMKLYDTVLSKDQLPAPAPEPQENGNFWQDKAAQYVAEEVLAECAADGCDTPEFAVRVLEAIFHPGESSRIPMLLPTVPTLDDRLDLALRLFREHDIPARVVNGVQLVDGRRRANLVKTVEIYHDGAWHGYDVGAGRQGFPEQFLALRRGGKSLLDVQGGNQSSIRYSVIKTTIPASVLLASRHDAIGRTLASLSIYDLPVESQNAFMRIALVPLGIIIVVIIRNIIGIQTMGTFMPVLIAMAFTETSLGPGLFAFVCIVALGLVIRSFLSHLNLLLVPRIGAVVLVVIFLMKLFSLVSYEIGFEQGLSVTLFPLIIMAWTIERASILWEEDGPRNTLRQLAASLATGVVCYLAMTNRYARHLTFAFAEIDLILMGLLLLLGSYTGYRLTELKRFSPLAGKK